MNNNRKLRLIKIIHTIIWAFFVSIIFYVVYSGFSGNITLYTWIAIGLVVGEGLVLLLFRMFCPLTVLARRYSDAPEANFDIFLPGWLAKYNKIIFTTIFLIGLVVVLIRFKGHM